MTYKRVIPRDLFNEANLLKCYGRIYINLETTDLPHVELEHDGSEFQVEQDAGSGGIYIANVLLKVAGEPVRLCRPLNSRDGWPLCLVTADDEDIPLFDDDGAFSEEAIAFLRDLSPKEVQR